MVVPPALDKKWHLAETELEIKVTEFEFHLWRLFYSFILWQEDCERYVCGDDMNAFDIALLHIVRMREKPKTLYEIARLLNRADPNNIQYSLNKFVKRGLVEKISAGKKSLNYQITRKGIKHTDRFRDAKRDILVSLYKDFKLDVGSLTNIMVKIKEIYDEASRRVSQLKI